MSVRTKGLAFAALLLVPIFNACSDATDKEPQQQEKVTQVELSEGEKLAQFFAEKFEEGVARSPEFQTILGRNDNNHLWDDYSDAFASKRYDITKQNLLELRRDYDIDKLDHDDRLSYRMFETRLERFLKGSPFRYHNYPVNQMFGAHTNFPQMLVERYIVSPGQATSYKIGMQKILDLRAEARTGLGEKFDLREFHNVVLKNGPVPLDVLEEEVIRWVEEVNRAKE